jgi:succinoglycan biosynthesis protein ExoA
MISVLCPTLNESHNIEKIIQSYLASKPKDKELLIIDGCSNDETVEIVKKYSHQYPEIRLLINKDKYVSFALNMGIKFCNGNPIIRIDAHCEYSGDYFEKILETFDKSGADIVGGPFRIKSNSHIQCAIGFATSSRFGVGNSLVHQQNYEGYSDHVAFGAWKKEIFDKIGFFDEKLIRNQDDEFHYRAKSSGIKIYQSPSIKLWYFPRNKLSTLAIQYFQYGLFKPLVLKKVKSEIKIRHLIPSFFTLYIFSLVLFYNISLFILPLLLYLAILISYSFLNKEKISTKLFLLIVIQ